MDRPRFAAMTAANSATTTPPVAGSGYVFPLIGSLVLTLIWGSYTVWVVLEILSQHP